MMMILYCSGVMNCHLGLFFILITEYSHVSSETDDSEQLKFCNYEGCRNIDLA